MEERLHVRPDLVGFCPRERLKHTFTPGGGNRAPPLVKGIVHPKNPHYLTDYINRRRCALPDRTGRTPRPAPSEFHRISASV